MSNLKGTETLKNLMAAFAGESQARNRYTFWSSIAKKEGYVEVSKIFEETANQEKEHAKRLMKLMNTAAQGETLPVAGEFPVLMGTTVENLKAAAAGENEEWTSMYKEMAEDARNEGFTRIAAQMEMVAKVEKEHEERYQKLLDDLKAQKTFAKDEPVVWQCEICGYTVTSKTAPKVCPLCGYKESFFEIKKENY